MAWMCSKQLGKQAMMDQGTITKGRGDELVSMLLDGF